MLVPARTSFCSWRFAMTVGIAALTLGHSSAGVGAASPVSATPRLAASLHADSDDRIANALFGQQPTCAGSRQPVSDLSLASVSATSLPSRLFTVTGSGFTAGGRVYLAIDDQAGIQPSETRWITASLPLVASTELTGHEAAPGSGLGRGGTFSETFDHVDGATASIRAYDQATNTWSTWPAIEPICGASVTLRTDLR